MKYLKYVFALLGIIIPVVGHLVAKESGWIEDKEKVDAIIDTSIILGFIMAFIFLMLSFKKQKT